ncbi:hypothetical protein [Mycolicibacterium fortuitum]|nr:hypothetical protein [Mycolicibacterium fortuitum]
MIRRFFDDGLHWVAVFGAILGTAVFGMYSGEPTAPAPIVVEAVQP